MEVLLHEIVAGTPVEPSWLSSTVRGALGNEPEGDCAGARVEVLELGDTVSLTITSMRRRTYNLLDLKQRETNVLRGRLVGCPCTPHPTLAPLHKLLLELLNPLLIQIRPLLVLLDPCA